MKIYQKIAVGLMSIASLGLTSCNDKYPPQVEPKYLSGIVKSESFEDNWVDPDKYNFILKTEEGLKFLMCTHNAQKMNNLLDAKDQVKIKIPFYQKNKNNDFIIDLTDIVEINGEPFSY